MSGSTWVDAAWWRGHAGDARVVPIDVRPAADYAAGHLPGARHFDPAPFAPTASTPEAIARFVARLEWAFSALGLDGSERVLVYEDGFDVRAARAAWTFEYLGHPGVSILEGGLRSVDAPLSTRPAAVVPGRFRARPEAGLLATAQDLAEARGDAVVLDTRRVQEYLGSEARNGRAGRIPGALHRDDADNRLRDGGLRPAAELREAFAAIGLREGDRVVTYCGGGGRAAHSYYALKRAGYRDVGVYLPSWGEWGRRAELPVEAGPPAARVG